eukprot:scaffold5337_cov167-Amphora_coffeaeformis.AAC.5
MDCIPVSGTWRMAVLRSACLEAMSFRNSPSVRGRTTSGQDDDGEVLDEEDDKESRFSSICAANRSSLLP